jgi:hypothetical protein
MLHGDIFEYEGEQYLVMRRSGVYEFVLFRLSEEIANCKQAYNSKEAWAVFRDALEANNDNN